MSISPEDFLAEARTLLKRTDEMGVRLAINRAYYGAYHEALTVSHHCPTPPPPPPGKREGDHLALIRRFREVPKKGFQGTGIARQIAALLSRSRDLRSGADYVLRQTFSAQEAKATLQNAEQIKALVAQFATLYTP